MNTFNNRKGVKPTDRPEPPPSHQESPGAAYSWEDDFTRSIEECYREIKRRQAAGGPGWTPKEPKS